MTPRVIAGDAARSILAQSLARLVRAVAVSLGPARRAVLCDRGAATAEPAKCGVEIARSLTEESGPWSIAPRVLVQTLVDAERDLQDGTARLACLTGAIFREGQRAIASGASPSVIADSLLHLLPRLDHLLADEACAMPDVCDVAEAACNDRELASALSPLGAALHGAGIVDVREGWRSELSVQSASGFVFDVHPDAAGFPLVGRQATVLDDVSVLVLNELVEDFGSFARIMDAFVDKARALLIVARGFGPEARAALSVNHDRLGMKLLGLMPADVSMRAVGVLEDLALATGATLVNEDLGMSLAQLRPAMLGHARQLLCSDGRVILADPAGDAEAVGRRQRALTSEAARQRYLALDRDHLLRRVARLAGAWAEVRVGESPGCSAAKRVTRAKAAISAIRSAAADGVVPGGGVAFARVAHLLVRSSRGSMNDDRLARRCVAAGCNSVLHWIATNAGSDGRHAVALAAGPAQDAIAYDASRRCAVPLREWSVTDPLSTTQSILRRAVSTAATLLRVETLVCC